MTGQDILNRMEILNAELQLQPGETDATRGLLAVNIAQDYFESLAALRGKGAYSSVGTITTTANQEATTFPAGVLRIDRLQELDSVTQFPKRELRRLQRAGGQASSAFWPLNLTYMNTGEPWAYWTNKTSIYWSPVPDNTYTIRWYGFQAAADVTAGGTFVYDDIVSLPMATFACRVLKLGVDDDPAVLSSLSTELFSPVLDTVSLFNRDGAVGLEYTDRHLA